MLKIDGMRLGPIMTNVYILYDDEVKEALVIDPAAGADAIGERIRKLGLKPGAILLTHGHGDHIGAVNELSEKLGMKVYAHEDEKEMLLDPDYNLSSDFGLGQVIKPDVFVKDNTELDLGGLHIKVIHTPGHTPGSVCYYIENENVLMSGDTMFNCSYGRTDFPGGSQRKLMESLRRLLELPDETHVLPGHESDTFIKNERRWY